MANRAEGLSCPICGRAADRVVRDRVKGDKPVNVIACDPCDLEFLETWTDRQRAADFYAAGDYVFHPKVDGSEQKFDEYRLRVARMRPYLTPQTSLLEIGAGSGIFLSAVRASVARADAVEIVGAHIDGLRAEGYHVYDRPIEECVADRQYDVVCMFAVLEHIPRVVEFLEHVKRFLRPDGMVFIEVPDRLDPLCHYYDIPEYRDFYYREYHLYYFTEHSLSRLLARAGFAGEYEHLVQASLANHFHWLHQGKGQANTTAMTNVTLPRPMRADACPDGASFGSLLDTLDDQYRGALTRSGVGDLLACRAWLA